MYYTILIYNINNYIRTKNKKVDDDAFLFSLNKIGNLGSYILLQIYHHSKSKVNNF